jgi:D-glycero-D-manno-heptose 1,7-bisphosphate phosphatase
MLRPSDMTEYYSLPVTMNSSLALALGCDPFLSYSYQAHSTFQANKRKALNNTVVQNIELLCIILNMNPALLLDRDGVIIENCESYVRSWNDVQFFPQALKALQRVSQKPIKIVLVTNQSAVGRGLVTECQVVELNQRIVQVILRSGGRVDGVYLCPHKPEDGCNCRKPLPGLLLQAARELSIDLPNSIMIGDALSDIMAGRSAGVKTLALVKTGRGAKQLTLPNLAEASPFLVFDSLFDALEKLLPS